MQKDSIVHPFLLHPFPFVDSIHSLFSPLSSHINMFHIRNKRKQSADKTNSVAASVTGTPSPSMRSERRYSLRRVPSQLSNMLKSIDLHHHGNHSNNGSDSHLPQVDNTNGRTSRRQSMTKATIAKISSSTEQRFNKLLRHTTRRGSHQQEQEQQPSHLPLPRVKKDPFFNPKRASWSPFGNERWPTLVQVKENVAATDDTKATVPSTPRLPPLEDQSSFLLDVPSSSVSVTNSTESSNSISNIKKRRNSSAIRHHDTNGDTSCAACLASSRRKQPCHSSEKIIESAEKTMNVNNGATNDHHPQQYTMAEKQQQQQPLVQEVMIPTTTPMLSQQHPAAAATPSSMTTQPPPPIHSTNVQEAESSNSDEKRVGDVNSLPASVVILQAISGNDNHAAAILVSPCVKKESPSSSCPDNTCQLAQNIVQCIQLVDQVEPAKEPLFSFRSCLISHDGGVHIDDHKQKVQACQSLLKQLHSSKTLQPASQASFSSTWSLLYPALWLGGTMAAGSIVSEHAKTGHIVIAGTCIANDHSLLPKEVSSRPKLNNQ